MSQAVQPIPMPALEWPTSSTEAAEVLAACAKDGKAVIPFGECLSPNAGGPPSRSDVGLVLERLSGIVAFDPEDLTLIARAGTPLAEISNALEPHKLQLPGAPSSGGSFGGLLACGWSEPGAVAVHGRLRDRILGMEVASPDGHVTRSGGRVVKNVTGLDLHRMHAGACGAFGVITEACVRLEPMAETSRTLAFEADSVEAIVRAWRWLRAEGPDPTSLAVRLVAEGARAIAVFAGDTEPVEAMAKATASGWSTFGQASVSDESGDALVGPLASPRDGLALTISVAPSEAIERLSWLRGEAKGLELDAVACPMLGSIHVVANGPREALGSMWETVARDASAHFRIEAIPNGLRRATPYWSADPSALRLLARLKKEFDPTGVLRPGSWSVDALQAAATYFEGAR